MKRIRRWTLLVWAGLLGLWLGGCDSNDIESYDFEPLELSATAEAFGSPVLGLTFTQQSSIVDDKATAVSRQNTLRIQNLTSRTMTGLDFQVSVFDSSLHSPENRLYRSGFQIENLPGGQETLIANRTWDQVNWAADQIEVTIFRMESQDDSKINGSYQGDFALIDSVEGFEELGFVDGTIAVDGSVRLYLGGNQDAQLVTGQLRSDGSFSGFALEDDGTPLYPITAESGAILPSLDRSISVEFAIREANGLGPHHLNCTLSREN